MSRKYGEYCGGYYGSDEWEDNLAQVEEEIFNPYIDIDEYPLIGASIYFSRQRRYPIGQCEFCGFKLSNEPHTCEGYERRMLSLRGQANG